VSKKAELSGILVIVDLRIQIGRGLK
jgi:hypothetical protein